MATLTDEITIETSDVFVSVVAEMANESTATLEVPMDSEKVARFLAEDPNPHKAKFVTVEIRSGFSKSKRNWRPEILEGIAKQINERHPVGNKGHIKRDDYDTIYPEPQTVWLGATVHRSGNQAVLRVKGYNLPNSSIRHDLLFDAVNGVSVFGTSKLKPIAGGHEVVEFDLESIDWSRKNRSGMAAEVVAVTSENAPERRNTVEPKDIAALSEDELRTHAPLLVKEIESKVTKPLEEKVGEMTTAAEATKPDVDVLAEIRKLLKLENGENVVERVTALLSKVEESAKSEVREFIRELVGKKVKTERGQALVLRLVGEMVTEDDLPLTDEKKKEIEEKFEKTIDDDEDLKAIVGEMAVFTDDSRQQQRGGASLGGRSQAGESRERVGAFQSGTSRKHGSVTITRQRLS